MRTSLLAGCLAAALGSAPPSCDLLDLLKGSPRRSVEHDGPSVRPPRIEGRVVHEETGRSVARFRIFLRGEGLEGCEVDGADFPFLKRGWNCVSSRSTANGGWERITPEPRFVAKIRVEEGQDLDLGEISLAAPGAATGSYRFSREVVGGTGRFEWRIEADGCDPATGFVELREGRTADVGEVRLRRGSAIIEGRVLDVARRPVPEAKVKLHGLTRVDPPTRALPDFEKTDGEGRYRFERVAAGRGWLELESPSLPAMPAAAVWTAPGETTGVEFAPEAGSVLVCVQPPSGGRWDLPFALVLHDPQRLVTARWTVAPPIRLPWGPGFSSPSWGSLLTSCFFISEGISLGAFRPDRLPQWYLERPRVDGRRADVRLQEDGLSVVLPNVLEGGWSVTAGWASDFYPPDADWSHPPFTVSPERVVVEAGEQAQVFVSIR